MGTVLIGSIERVWRSLGLLISGLWRISRSSFEEEMGNERHFDGTQIELHVGLR